MAHTRTVYSYDYDKFTTVPRVVGGVSDIDASNSPDLRPITVDQYGNVNVSISDQYTEALGLLFHTIDASGSLLNTNTALNSYTIELSAGHSVVTGSILCLKENGRFSQFRVTNVATNIITLDMPLDYGYTTGAFVGYGSANLNQSGSLSTPVYAYIGPQEGQQWDIYGFSVVMVDGAAMDYSKFGGIASLTNGVTMRKVDTTIYKNIANIRMNADLELYGFGINIAEKTGGGEYSLRGSFNIHETSGVSIRLNGDNNDKLQLIIRDDLSAISIIKVLVHGHVVQNL